MVNSHRVSHPVAEIAAVLILPLTALWITPATIPSLPDRQRLDLVLGILTLLIAVGLNLYHGEGRREVGLRVDNIAAAARELSWLTLGGTLALLAIGTALGSIHLGRRFAVQLLVLPAWGLQQQYGIQSIINRRYQVLFGKGKLSIWLTASTFAALHLPNPILAAATLLAGYVWSAVFQRHPNLIVNALSHALLSAVLANSFSPALLHGMRAGLGYFSFR